MVSRHVAGLSATCSLLLAAMALHASALDGPPTPPAGCIESFESLGYEFPKDVAKVEYDNGVGDTRTPPLYRFAIRSDEHEQQYALVKLVYCQPASTGSTSWRCDEQSVWRIGGPVEVFVAAPPEVDAWIASKPAEALAPYVELLQRAVSVYPKDRWGSTPSWLRISEQGEKELVYSTFGGGCRTVFAVSTETINGSLKMHIDLKPEVELCI